MRGTASGVPVVISVVAVERITKKNEYIDNEYARENSARMYVR